MYDHVTVTAERRWLIQSSWKRMQCCLRSCSLSASQHCLDSRQFATRCKDVRLKTWQRKTTFGINHARYIASISSLSTQRQMFLVQAEMKSFVFVQTSRVICSSDLPESILSSHSANIRISQQNIAQRLRMAQLEKTTRFSAAIHTDKDTLMLIIDAFCNKLSPSYHEDTEGRHWDYWQGPIRDRSLNDLKKRKLSFKWCANIMLSIHITSYC